MALYSAKDKRGKPLRLVKSVFDLVTFGIMLQVSLFPDFGPFIMNAFNKKPIDSGSVTVALWRDVAEGERNAELSNLRLKTRIGKAKDSRHSIT